MKVLVVEDSRQWQEAYARALRCEGIEVLQAFTVKDGAELFKANPDIKAVVMDACVPGEDPTTPPLVREIRKTFSGPMIAISGDPDYREKLIEAGCDHQCPKPNLPEKLCEILNL